MSQRVCIVWSALLVYGLANHFTVFVGAEQVLQPWQQCGGKSKCQTSSCGDRAWEAVRAGLSIRKLLILSFRHDPGIRHVWKARSQFHMLLLFLQFSCPSGFACTRQDEWYHQCRPVRSKCPPQLGYSDRGACTSSTLVVGSRPATMEAIGDDAGPALCSCQTDVLITRWSFVMLLDGLCHSCCRQQWVGPRGCERVAAVWGLQWVQQQ
jgi:hypothetical protein